MDPCSGVPGKYQMAGLELDEMEEYAAQHFGFMPKGFADTGKFFLKNYLN